MKIKSSIRLLRPKQWTKNLLVFAALIFTKGYSDPDQVKLCVFAFFALCMISSAVYAINDVLDAERDRAHPIKKKRPIASGELTVADGIVVAIICLIFGGFLASALSSEFIVGTIIYLALQIAYNLFFKKQPVLDVVFVSTGFVLRAVLGAVAISTQISGWLLFCTGALALLLASAKRRHEFHLMGDDKISSRSALSAYSTQALDAMVVFSAAIASMSYGIYAIESPTAKEYPSLLFTVPFVILGVLRYLFLTFAKNDGGEPENILLTDWQIIASVILFLVTAVYAIEGGDIPFLTNPTR